MRERIDGPARELALAWPAWGHRKIWALLQATATQPRWRPSSARWQTILLLQPAGRMRECRQLARARPNAFVDPPAKPNCTPPRVAPAALTLARRRAQARTLPRRER